MILFKFMKALYKFTFLMLAFPIFFIGVIVEEWILKKHYDFLEHILKIFCLLYYIAPIVMQIAFKGIIWSLISLIFYGLILFYLVCCSIINFFFSMSAAEYFDYSTNNIKYIEVPPTSKFFEDFFWKSNVDDIFFMALFGPSLHQREHNVLKLEIEMPGLMVPVVRVAFNFMIIILCFAIFYYILMGAYAPRSPVII